MKILAIASQKGGVGKTTVAINLAYALAHRGHRILIVDTDPQGSVGLSLSRGARERTGFYDALAAGEDPSRLVLQSRLPELKLLPAGRTDSFLAAGGFGGVDDRAVADALAALAAAAGVDVVVVDTPAGMSGVTTSVLRAADSVLIPQQAEPLGVRSVPQVLQAIAALRRKGHPLAVAGIVMTMVQGDQKESVEAEQQLRAALPAGLMCSANVPREVAFLKASGAGVPLGLLSKRPPAAAAVFDQLAAELEPKLGLGSPTEADPHGVGELVD